MAIYILGPDQDGNCCTCEERVNVCDTCTPASFCLEYRDRGAVGAPCGLRFDGSPNVYYKNSLYAGEICLLEENVFCDPSSAFRGNRIVLGGECVFVPGFESCVQPSSGTRDRYVLPVVTPPPVICTDFTALVESISICGTIGATQGQGISYNGDYTVATVSGDETCYIVGGTVGNIQFGTWTQTLSNPDTIDDIVSRTETGISGKAYSNWIRGTGTANFCVYDLDVALTEAEWRVHKSGFAPNTPYGSYVEYWRVPCTGGEYGIYQTLEFSGMSNALGVLITTGIQLPNTEGYYTQVRTPCLFSGGS